VPAVDDPGEPLVARMRLEPDTPEEAELLERGQRRAAEEDRLDAPHGEAEED